ncbi:MAG: hypothetical protein B6U69_00725 [Thermofilum sp. ex4484_15]|nr:MAG: hypothetical protein B6U69_00725 [Thermofilum sp. ex4484_15]
MIHYMIKEAKEGPSAISIVMKDEGVKALAEEVSSSSRIFLFGCGSSYNIALYGAKVAEALDLGPETYAMPSSEFDYFINKLRKDDLAIAISRSGETSETLNVALKIARRGLRLFAITNDPSSSLAKASIGYASMGGGREESIVMTKTFLAGCLALLRAFKVSKGYDLSGELPYRLGELINNYELRLREYSEEFSKAKLAVNLGHSYTYPIALESSIKLTETSLIPSVTYYLLEFRHGPKALIEKGVYVIAFLTKDEHYDLYLDLIHEVRSLGAKITLITNYEGDGDMVIRVGVEDPLEASALFITPIHLLSYYSAVRRNLNPDKPRHLSKVVKIKGLR